MGQKYRNQKTIHKTEEDSSRTQQTHKDQIENAGLNTLASQTGAGGVRQG